MPQYKRGLFYNIRIAAGLAVSLFLLNLLGVVNFHEPEALDLRLRLRGQHSADSRILVVRIDDNSIASIGQWPWPRGVHAALIDIASKYNPALIFLDVLFTESSPDKTQDEKLEAAVASSGKVILPFYYASERPFAAQFPIAELRKASAGTAYVNIDPDPDGRVRSFRPFLDTAEGRFFHPAMILSQPVIPGRFPVKPARESTRANEALVIPANPKGQQKTRAGIPLEQSKKEMGSPMKTFGDDLTSLPLDAKKKLLINYPGTGLMIRQVSFGQVIRMAGMEKTEELKRLFSGAIVIVGHTATGTTDLKPTAFSPQEPGVFVQASALHTLLTKKFLRPLPGALHLLLLFVMSLAGIFLKDKLEPLKGVLALSGAAAGYALVNFLIFIFTGWVLPLSVPLAALVLSYALTLFLKYLEVQVQREMMERELKAASDLQASFLPHQTPQLKNIDAAFECRFAREVGGDLYDWIELCDQRLAFCVGDVSGKGMPAAIYMAKALSDFRRIEKECKNPGEVLQSLNATLSAGDNAGMFLTLIYAVLDLPKKKLSYSSAGHEPLILYRAKTGTAEILKEAQGRPLGIFEESEYATAALDFSEGDALLMLSDGVKELRNGKKEEFGLERLRKFLTEKANGAEASAIIAGLFKEMESYQGNTPAHDDRTLFFLRLKNLSA